MMNKERNFYSGLAVLLFATGLLPPAIARADQGGVSFWVPGIYASMAAVPADPGFSMPSTFYFYSGKGDSQDRFGIGGLIAADVEAKGFEGIFLAPTWVPETPVANGRLALTMMGVVANNEIEANVNFQRIPVDIHRTDDTLGVGDLYPSASISWNSGVNNYKLYATGDIPVGDYDPKRLANIGIGHGAIDGGGAYTYFNPETGHELSGTLGFTYNFENTESEDYKNGIDMHLDWGVSQWLSKTTMFGVAGYLYYQLTDDTYPTDTPLGLLRERFWVVIGQRSRLLGRNLPISSRSAVFRSIRRSAATGNSGRTTGCKAKACFSRPSSRSEDPRKSDAQAT